MNSRAKLVMPILVESAFFAGIGDLVYRNWAVLKEVV